MGREQVLAAALAMLDGAELADLLSFLGIRAVAEAADVQPSTVHHHFANRTDNPKRNARLAAAILEAALGEDGGSQRSVAEATAVTESAVDAPDLATLRIVARENLEHFLSKRRMAVATFLGAAAAGNDPVARDVLREEYESLLAGYSAMFESVADLLGRRFDVEHGFTAESFSVVATALVDGLMLRHQFDPERVRPVVFAEVVLRLFEAATVVADAEAEDDAVVERLLRGRGTLDPPAGSQLDQGKRARIVDAARALFEQGGADALTVTAVAREAGVGRSTVIANFGGRGGLAGAVWAQYVPALEGRLDADRARGVPLARAVERHLHRVVELCRTVPELTAVLLEGMVDETIRTGFVTGDRADDPRTAVPLAALLEGVLRDAADQLRPGVLDDSPQGMDVSSSITFLAMARAITRPDEPTSESVQFVVDLFFDGILAREG